DDAPGFRRGNGIDAELVSRFGHVVQAAAGDEGGIAVEVMRRQDDVLGGVADVAEETVAPVVKGSPEAGAPGLESEAEITRIDPEIGPGHGDVGGVAGTVVLVVALDAGDAAS